MEIKKLLEVSKIHWDNISELEASFESILELISSLPEAQNLETSHNSYAILSNDEEDQKAKKEDILEGDMFVI